MPRSSARDAIGDLARRPFAPLQTHFLGNATANRSIIALVEQLKPDIVIVDMLRLGAMAQVLRSQFPEMPMMLELDDLLSLRYQRMLGYSSHDILGAYGRSLPPSAQMLAKTLPSMLLRVEQKLIAQAERRIPDLYDSVSTVGLREARLLSDMLGDAVKIRDIPPIFKPVRASACPSSAIRFIFIGDANYGPNATALRALDRIAGSVKAALPEAAVVAFETIGTINPALNLTHLKPLGFVDDLPRAIHGATAMVAPVCIGSGIKLKVLDAAASGVPIITSAIGVESLPLRPGAHYLHADCETDYVQHLLSIVHGEMSPGRLQGMATNTIAALSDACEEKCVFARFEGLVHAAIERRSRLKPETRDAG
ncbi:MAG: glycosyltransferase family 4 protein [Devosiaceae bacterium]